MKRLILSLILTLAVPFLFAHEPGEDTATIELGGGKVSIHYGTPKLGERNLDEMIKPGTAWRMGMNKPTVLETAVALNFGGKKLEPGKYTLFARVDENKSWSLVISSSARFEPAGIVVEAPLHFMKDTKAQDLLKITLEKTSAGASLLVAWGTYRLHGTFKAA